MVKVPDLSNLSAEELDAYREALEKATKAEAERRKAAAIKAVHAVSAEHGFELHELFELKKSPKRKPVPAKPKYEDPNDPTKTWSGMGRTPAFIQELLDSGKTLEDLLIKSK